jgi:hypothetical protein
MSKLNVRAKKRLETKSRQYMDQLYKDYKRNPQKTNGDSTFSAITFDQTIESTADPNKYLSEIECLLKKFPDL